MASVMNMVVTTMSHGRLLGGPVKFPCKRWNQHDRKAAHFRYVLKTPGCTTMAMDVQSTLWSPYYDSPTVALDAMIGSTDSLEDFCRSYFMFHDLDPDSAQSVFKYIPVLLYFDSYVYKLDNLNESLLHWPANGEDEPTLGKDPWRPLITALDAQGLMTKRIEEELTNGLEFWALERKYCRVGNINISIEDVKRVLYLKSTDYRVMSLLLYQLRGEKVNELHMEFLSISAMLVEISDDLFDYKDDVLKNTFNILRLFVKYYGASLGPIKLVEFVSQAQEKYDRLIKELEPELAAKFRKRYEDGMKEGLRTFGPSSGTWSMPEVIEDEIQYRKTFSTSTA